MLCTQKSTTLKTDTILNIASSIGGRYTMLKPISRRSCCLLLDFSQRSTNGSKHRCCLDRQWEAGRGATTSQQWRSGTLYEKFAKNVTVISRKKSHLAAILAAHCTDVCRHGDVSIVSYALFCAVWAVLASLQENLTCRCLHVVRLLLIALRWAE